VRELKPSPALEVRSDVRHRSEGILATVTLVPQGASKILTASPASPTPSREDTRPVFRRQYTFTHGTGPSGAARSPSPVAGAHIGETALHAAGRNVQITAFAFPVPARSASPTPQPPALHAGSGGGGGTVHLSHASAAVASRPLPPKRSSVLRRQLSADQVVGRGVVRTTMLQPPDVGRGGHR
jgi:hypothetical protein